MYVQFQQLFDGTIDWLWSLNTVYIQSHKVDQVFIAYIFTENYNFITFMENVYTILIVRWQESREKQRLNYEEQKRQLMKEEEKLNQRREEELNKRRQFVSVAGLLVT